MHLANDAYQIAAARTERCRHSDRLGELWLQTHDNGEAVKSFADAMEADENYLPAQLGWRRPSSTRIRPRAEVGQA
jgi:hypothetical protein